MWRDNLASVRMLFHCYRFTCVLLMCYHGDGKRLTMAAPTAMPVKPICTREGEETLTGCLDHEADSLQQRRPAEARESHLGDRSVDDAFVSVLLPQTPAHLYRHGIDSPTCFLHQCFYLYQYKLSTG